MACSVLHFGYPLGGFVFIPTHHVLRNYDGVPLRHNDGSDLQWGRACCLALVAVLPGDDRATLDDKLARDSLCRRIFESGRLDQPVEVTVEEASIIKDRVNKCYPSPSVVGAIVRHMESATAVTPGFEGDPA